MKAFAIAIVSIALISFAIFPLFRAVQKQDASENLAFSCRRSDPDAVSDVLKYIDQGADLNFELNGDRPLDRAAEAGNVFVVRVLLERGAKLGLAKKSTGITVQKMLSGKNELP